MSLGNEFNKHRDKEADSTLEAAWDVGVRDFDVAPWYGFGLAERRFGRLGKKRDEYLLSSKVGKLFKVSKNNRHSEIYPLWDSPNEIVFDYTADGCAARGRGAGAFRRPSFNRCRRHPGRGNVPTFSLAQDHLLIRRGHRHRAARNEHAEAVVG